MTQMHQAVTADEAERRLPTIQYIDDTELREAVLECSRHAPPYFWERPGAYSGYHNGHEHGLWLHTLKHGRVIERLAPSYVERDELDAHDVDRLHAAAILHDQRKNGVHHDAEDTASNHDVIMADVVNDFPGLDPIVARAIESHMGPWGEGRTPTSALDEVLHVADMMASDDAIDVAIPEPVPEELEPFVDETVVIE